MKSSSVRILIAAAVLLAAAVGIIYSMFAPAGPTGRVTVMIPNGASASGVAEILKEEGVIRSAFGFKLLARLTGKSADLKPGAYDLNPGAGPGDALDQIASGDVSARWITIPEGFTIRQIGDRLEAAKIGSAERFLELARYGGSSFQTKFSSPGGNLEGFLFPDTYLVPNASTEEDVIRLMLDAFDRKVAGPMTDEIARSGMSLQQCVTLASLVEREARISKDRPLVSAVIHNRLRKNMRLEIDATVLYALGHHKGRVLYRDLDVDSPYNTYRNPGLPPGPIASPGLQSIRAAIHPARVSYLYYVARPDGSHIFSQTFEQHQAAIRSVRRGSGN